MSGAGAAAPLRAIILYKSLKAALQLSLAALLAVWWPRGLPQALLELSSWLREHVTHGWAAQLAARLARLLETESSSRRLLIPIVAFGLDGTLTLVEAWALHLGRAWGAWLVVGTTAALLPFEVYEFARAHRWSRAFIFVLNVLIVAYLVRRAGRERTSVASK